MKQLLLFPDNNRILSPFFSYYGSKWRLANLYPSPEYKSIIEPFAGSACYSLHYPNLDITLIDKSEVICSVWDYLIRVSESEILSLPLLQPKEKIPRYLPVEACRLIGFWTSKAAASPRKEMSNGQLQYIRHWKIKHGCYSEIQNNIATWFIDPPYQIGGNRYIENQIDYTALSKFCLGRDGQVIVCENGQSNWLPFREFIDTKGMRKNSKELIWTNKEKRILVDDKERARLKSKGQNCKQQMEDANWPVTLDLLIGFMEAQTNLTGDDLQLIRWQLEEIAKEIL